MQAIQPPDIYGVVVDGERGSRPTILAQEEILRDAVLDLKPMGADQLSPGTRVCAFWSQQYRCLYPGTVSKVTLQHSQKSSSTTASSIDNNPFDFHGEEVRKGGGVGRIDVKSWFCPMPKMKHQDSFFSSRRFFFSPLFLIPNSISFLIFRFFSSMLLSFASFLHFSFLSSFPSSFSSIYLLSILFFVLLGRLFFPSSLLLSHIFLFPSFLPVIHSLLPSLSSSFLSSFLLSLHPPSFLSPNQESSRLLVHVEFDDGDSGRIPLDEIRMLPSDSSKTSTTTTRNGDTSFGFDASSDHFGRKRRSSELHDENDEETDEEDDEDDDAPPLPPQPSRPSPGHDPHTPLPPQKREHESTKPTAGSSGKPAMSGSSHDGKMKSSLKESHDKIIKHENKEKIKHESKDKIKHESKDKIKHESKDKIKHGHKHQDKKHDAKSHSTHDHPDKKKLSISSKSDAEHKSKNREDGEKKKSHSSEKKKIHGDCKGKWAHRPPPLKIDGETSKAAGLMPAVETGTCSCGYLTSKIL